MSSNPIEFPPAFLIIRGAEIFYCTKEVITIGRSTNNDLILAYPQVSRNHAQIVYRDGIFLVEDRDSMGGTYVNGRLISSYALNKGDVITLADVHLIFGQDTSLSEKHLPVYVSPGNHVDNDIQTKNFKT